ncbi:hypothetical protein SmJEL517_g01883 [Synchytrium microbalum]|uniref:Indoleamine 2,3-dioxygenase n=1 Tax=Synchytrium microbalum TaxID=1806994 RepID=A0A507CDU3_9FUNG|nr:uncharacterized protein SmJEL517_g01883 [Synchytrium microbalum]TPX35713.1 hypothetical protein SmJEL517_g01883 [Synchytrium microbalum]
MPVRDGAIPDPAQYDIHPITGFLPSGPNPISRLPAYFEPWEVILDRLSALLLAGRLRESVKKLPILDAKQLDHHREWQRAYVVLAFIGQAYIWGKNEEAEDILPESVAVPYVMVCNRLGLKPVLSYAAVVLYNHYLIDPEGPLDLSNFGVMHTFSGGMDEAWFYLVSIAIEAAGAPAIPAMINAMHAVVNRNIPALETNLLIIAQAIERINETLVAMYEKNDPHIFFHRVRPYVAGWEHTPEMPLGLFYEGVVVDFEEKDGFMSSGGVTGTASQNGSRPGSPLPTKQSPVLYNNMTNGTFKFPGGHIHSSKHRKLPNPLDEVPQHEDHGVVGWVKADPPSPGKIGTWGKWAGASAGQSSLLHALDVALGIDHYPTRPVTASETNQHDPGVIPPRNTPGHLPPSSSLSNLLNNSNNSLINGHHPHGSSNGTSNHTSPITPSPGSAINHIHEMRKYMPGAHRDFIYALGRAPSIRSFIQELGAYTSLGMEAERLFNRCVEGLRIFRDMHFKIVTVYIIIQASKKKEAGVGSRPNPAKGGASSGSAGGSNSGVVSDNASLRVRQTLIARGTGGTDLAPFLRQSRTETAQARLGAG